MKKVGKMLPIVAGILISSSAVALELPKNVTRREVGVRGHTLPFIEPKTARVRSVHPTILLH